VGKRTGLLAFGIVAAGAIAGVALEELIYKRVTGRPDPERDEPIGSVPGTTCWVTSFDGTRLYARSYGPADCSDAIVFAHGIVENHVIWHYLVRDLRADGRYRLVAYDARGHGNSGPARGPDGTTAFDGATLGHDLAAVVEQTTTDRVLLVGHSLGGMAALVQLIADRTERTHIAGAVIVNSTYTSKFPGWRGRLTDRTIVPLGDLAVRLAGEDAKRLDRVRVRASDLAILAARALFGRDASTRQIAVAFHMFETTPAQTIAAAADLLAYDVSQDLRNIDVPVLVVTGSRDVLTPAFLSREMAEQIPGAELVVLGGCGHMAPFERHDELTAHVRKLAERVFA
jgi:pimeloyl-ACP methyl ester carboxylesterase